MSIHLRNVTWWDWRTEELRHGDLAIASGPTGEAGLTTAAPAPGDDVIDGRGGLALPGLVCGHHHLYSGLARGMPAPARAPRNFAEILASVWWRLDRCLDGEMIRASALAAGIDALRCGVTCIVDHHASPRAIAGSLDLLAGALDDLGLAHVLCLELSDRDGPAAARVGLDETAAYLRRGRPALVGLHASFTVSDQLLHDAVDLAREHGTGIHVHAAEDLVDQRHCLAEHGMRVVERFAAAGALGLPGSLLAHCLHLNERERSLLHASPAWVVHNPESNQNNAVGTFRGDDLDPARIMLGTDGLHADMLRSARAAYLCGRAVGGFSPAGAWRALWNGRRYLAAHHPAAARHNDVVVLDYTPPTPLTPENLPGHACFGLDARHVRTVIAGGRVVLREGKLTTIDEPAVLAHCREQAGRLWRAMAEESAP
jgi:cytosine/adenosine deaminase-related metal-dependent hydrolase